MTVRERHPAWQPPPGWLRLTTLDAHAAGEPLRIVTGGFPDLPGNARLTGKNEFWIDPDDPLGHGFILR